MSPDPCLLTAPLQKKKHFSIKMYINTLRDKNTSLTNYNFLVQLKLVCIKKTPGK